MSQAHPEDSSSRSAYRPSSLVEQAFARLFARLLGLWVKPEVLPAAPASVLDDATPVLYLLEVGGIADRTALDLVCEAKGLPRPGSPLVYAGTRHRSRVDVVRKRQGTVFRKHHNWMSPKLAELIDASDTADAEDLQVVPVSVFWGRAPDRESSFWGLFYSENWEVAGRTRKFLTTLLHGRNTLLNISEPVLLQTLRASADADATTEVLQRKLLRILRVHFRQRRLASLGPDLSHRRMLIDGVLKDHSVRLAIDAASDGDDRRRAKAMRKAADYAHEIAADVSFTTIRMLQRPLTRLWNELYDGVQFDGVTRLKAVADGHEIVYVPCHRSHVDYLLLSWLLYTHGFSLPHVAAGVNLNLPVVGGVLRRGGAFFLRRTFSGNALYAAVFNAYLKEIVQRGHSLEYFVEGGRSRTGRLLPPKSGMLAMTSHAYLRNPRLPVVFVPVYFGYERLLEGKAFTSELSGGKKQKETVFALLKSLRKLRENYGRVFVNIGEPIRLDALLTKHHDDWRNETVAETRPSWLTPVVDELGLTIMRRINACASVTPVSLLATALLATPRGSVAREALENQVELYHRLLAMAHADTTVVVPPIKAGEVVDHGIELGFVEVLEDELGALVSIVDGQAAPLTYFRNNILHLLTLPALVASAFTNARTREPGALERVVRLSHPFLQAELYSDESLSSESLERTLSALQQNGLIHPRESDGHWQRAAAGSSEAVSLLRLAQVTTPALERDYLAAALVANAPGGTVERKVLEHRCRLAAHRLAITHGKDAGDLHDRHLLGVFLQQLEKHAYIERAGTTIRAMPALIAMEQDARTLLSEQVRHAILSTVHACHSPLIELPEAP